MAYLVWLTAGRVSNLAAGISSRRCLMRRRRHNQQQHGVEWHMKIEDARSKLISSYPKIKV
jgi:hypothetical protein